MAVLTTTAALTAAGTAAAGTTAAAGAAGAGIAAGAATAAGAAATTAGVAAGTGAAAGGIGLAGAGTIAAGVGGVGQAVMARKTALEQQKIANVANARERKKALSSMRLARARIEAMGVATNTSGASSQTSAMGAEMGNAASAIGFQNQQTASMNKVSGYNAATTGFGILQQGGMFTAQNPELLGSTGKKLFS